MQRTILFFILVLQTAFGLSAGETSIEDNILVLKGRLLPYNGLRFEPEQLKIWLADASSTYEADILLHDDLAFEAKYGDVPAGKYTIYTGVFLLEENAQIAKAFQHGFVTSGKSMSVDLGKVELVKKNFLPNGAEAPLFELTSITGEPVRLKDYRGKVVLLDFWASWCGHCKAAKPEILRLYEKYHKKYNFEIIGMSLDHDVDELKAYVEEHAIPWPQCYIGSFDHPIIQDYSIIAIPSEILISPQGKVLRKGLKGEHGILKHLEEILKNKKP